jgi:hypothetical protein
MSTCNKVNSSFSGRINSKRIESTCSGSGREILSCRRPSLWTVRTKPDFFLAQDSCTFLTRALNIWTRPRFATESSHITWDELLTSIGTPVEVPCHASEWLVAFFHPGLGHCRTTMSHLDRSICSLEVSSTPEKLSKTAMCNKLLSPLN